VETAPPITPDFGGLETDPDDGRVELTADRVHAYRLQDGLEYRGRIENRFAIVDSDPPSATIHSECEISVGRDAWRKSVLARARLACDATTFFVQVDLSAWEDDETVLTRDWSFTIPRDHV
jgi:uncharacterized protein